jgi:hypothetical protein
MISYIGCFACDFTASRGVELGNSLLDSALVAPAYGDLRSFIEHHLRDGAPDSTGRAGDEANFVDHMI